MLLIESPSVDPRFNLALEQYVFDCLPRRESYLMLWQNHNTIVIGKYQNTALEINSAYVKEHDITVVRRLSGGGAVYHDLGNLNFTFITDANAEGQYDIRGFCQRVALALNRLSLPVTVNGRNDLELEGKKFSGNAQYIRERRIMHHGAILFDSDLSVLSQALRPPADKLQGKGLPSVRSRVTNLRPYFPEGYSFAQFRQDLTRELLEGAETRPYELSREDMAAVERIKTQVYDKWEWNYGRVLDFEVCKQRRVEGCGSVQVMLNVAEGRILDLAFSGDYFALEDSAELVRRLRDCPLREQDLQQRLAQVEVERYFMNLDRSRLVELLLS